MSFLNGIVSMEYGVEAYCPAKHMKKEDGSYRIFLLILVNMISYGNHKNSLLSSDQPNTPT